MTRTSGVLLTGVLLTGAALAAYGAPAATHGKAIARGEHLVNISGCNDCHTPGWGSNDGHAPKDQLLTGGGLAFQGPWGTTFPVNLRLYVHKMTLRQWIHTLRTTKARPLMPWWTFRDMSDNDLASMYYYIRSLGPAGQPEHAYVPPGQEAPPPYLKLVAPAAPPAKIAEH